MNVRINNLLILVLTLAIAMVGCDRIEDDAFPVGDALFTSASDKKTITPGSSVIVDLSTAIQSSQPVSFRTGEAPTRGRVSFYSNGLMEYRPDDSFTSGFDKFTVEMVNLDSVVLDADEFRIDMVGEETDLPCFNGALGDFAWTAKGQSIIVLPLVNDGFCESEIESFSFRTDQPEYGEVNLISPLEVEYVPDPDFVGLDYFFYTLTLTDKSGDEFISTAKVEVEVSDEIPYQDYCAVAAFPNPHLVIEDEPLAEVYAIEYFNDEALCLFLPWSLAIVEAQQGTAEQSDDGLSILWYPGDEPLDSLVLIQYNIVFEDGSFWERQISVYREGFIHRLECIELSFPDQHRVIEELDLEYEFEIYFANDDCELPQWDIEVVETFHGEAEVIVSDNLIIFRPDEGPNTDNFYGVIYEVVLPTGERLTREIMIEVDDSFHFECIEQFIHPETVYFGLDQLAQGEVLIFELNDACELAIDSLEVISSELGAVTFDGGKVLFSPNDQFVDHAVVVLMVVLPETGDVFEKVIEIILEDDTFPGCAEDAFHNQYTTLDNKGQESFSMAVFFPPPGCPIPGWELSIPEVSNGEADIAANGQDIVWYPNYDEFEEMARIVYVVTFEDGQQLERVIELQFVEDEDCFETAFPNQELHLGTPANIQFEIQVVFPTPLCLFPAWELDITDVSFGTAEFNQETASIIYTLDSGQTDPVVVIAYNIVFENGDFEPRELALIFDEIIFENCAEAFEDEYFYAPLLGDTLGSNLPVIEPLIIDPAENDRFCTDNYEINILEQPDLGEAEVIEGSKLIQYQVFEEFAGRRETTIKYEICDNGKCDESFIYITVEQ